MRTVLLVMLLALMSNAHAGTYEDDLKKLLDMTGVINSYIGLNTQVIKQMQTAYLRAAEESIDGSNFTTDQKKKAGEILKSQFSAMVKNYEAHVKKSMPYDKVVDEVYIPLYKETYSANDVKELLVFYQSPLGKKTLEFSRDVNDKISKRIAENYDSLIFDFVKKQVDKGISRAKTEIAIQVK